MIEPNNAARLIGRPVGQRDRRVGHDENNDNCADQYPRLTRTSRYNLVTPCDNELLVQRNTSNAASISCPYVKYLNVHPGRGPLLVRH